MSGMMTKVWGPGCWLFLHCMVTGYPDKIDKKNKEHVTRRKHIIQFFKQLPYVLPCKYCRESFIKFGKELPVEKYADSNKDLCLWLYKMHCKVNKKLGIKTQPSFKQVCSKFNKFKAVCNKRKKGCLANAKAQSKKCKVIIEPTFSSLYDNEEYFNNLSIDTIHKEPSLFTVPSKLDALKKRNIHLMAKVIMESKDQVLLKKLYFFLQELIDNKKTWLIYGRDSCPYCIDAVEYMKKKGWNFEYRKISQMSSDEMNHIYKIVKRYRDNITVPIIFKLEKGKYRYIGGFSDIKQI